MELYRLIRAHILQNRTSGKMLCLKQMAQRKTKKIEVLLGFFFLYLVTRQENAMFIHLSDIEQLK